jgi:hypothetical protein
MEAASGIFRLSLFLAAHALDIMDIMDGLWKIKTLWTDYGNNEVPEPLMQAAEANPGRVSRVSANP